MSYEARSKWFLLCVFRADTAEERLLRMKKYYEFMLAEKTKPRLLQDLEDLAAYSVATIAAPTTPKISSPEQSKKKKASLGTMPNEMLDRIYDCLFLLESTEKIYSIADLPCLIVCHRFLDVGIRNLLRNQLFVLTSSERDAYCHALCTEEVAPPNPPEFSIGRCEIARYPETSEFKQTGGLLCLRSLLRLLPLMSISDPLSHITRLRVNIDIPTLKLEPIEPSVAAGPGMTVHERLCTYPQDFSSVPYEEKLEWYFADFTVDKAHYHMDILTKLPFKKLRTLELHFGNLDERNKREPAALLMRWIGWFLWHTRIRDRAVEVVVVDEHPELKAWLEDVIQNGGPAKE
ncbi:hypothetical protein H2201_005129 [Coniosporium apollinis]|uniref:F-box domain-containing protein n=1 Tax=Coniosporium apollinis TaxID=61459 RepID=A0ABQ9NU32_9PEZI|nr:hypothetical protein H2201_005129 [Coniosporium apollinis]